MAWTNPVDPVSGTTITRSWAITNVTDLLRWLRGLTGNADPPAAGHVARSTSTTLTAWYDLDTALDARVAKTSPGYSAFSGTSGLKSGFATVALPADGPVGSANWHMIQARSDDPSVYAAQLAVNVGFVNDTFIRVIAAGTPDAWKRVYHSGNLTSANGLVPSGMIAAFETAASIPSGWARYTAADGRFLIGAGTTFSQTFSENSNAGASSWAHQHSMVFESGTNNPAGGSVDSGSGSTAVPTHSHTVSGNTNDSTWIPPSRAIVWAKKS